MAIDVFREGMNDEVRAVFERPLEGWRGEGRVDETVSPAAWAASDSARMSSTSPVGLIGVSK